MNWTLHNMGLLTFFSDLPVQGSLVWKCSYASTHSEGQYLSIKINFKTNKGPQKTSFIHETDIQHYAKFRPKWGLHLTGFISALLWATVVTPMPKARPNSQTHPNNEGTRTQACRQDKHIWTYSPPKSFLPCILTVHSELITQLAAAISGQVKYLRLTL